MLSKSKITAISVPIDLTQCTNCSFMFNNALSLKTIEELILSDNTAGSNNMFASCGTLVNLTISGTIPFDFDLRRSKQLSKESIESIYRALSPNATNKTLTLNKAAVNAAFTDEEWKALTDAKSNWNYSLFED